MPRASLLWILLAVGGVLLVAGVTLAASRLSTQTIGLSSEPLSAGDGLSPQEAATPEATPNPLAAARRARVRRERARRAAARREQARAAATPAATAAPTADPTAAPAAAPTVTAVPPVVSDEDNSGLSGSDDSVSDDSGQGRGRGRGRGRGGDDDD